ncbi:MAG TPA: protein kinase [Ktedonobacteraceae bacterium]|nr:protein kinase [Ktedonobacteraceae bacterium]
MKGIEGFTLGRYELRRRIAQGGMSEVYLAYDRRVRRQVAIKVLYGRDVSFVRRFEREALAVGALSHNHILPLYDFGEQSPWYYLVMPYVEGGTLRDYLLKRKQITLEEAASFVDQIASALQYAHDSRVVHRDVKPSNILLRQDGYAYLVDFGLAKALMGAESLTSEGAMVGTPEYMAPEQSNGESDYRSDIYSLGVILYQMLTGRVPFMAESPVAISLKHIQTAPISPSKLNSTIPLAIEEVILKAMAKDPNTRYQQAQELSAAYWKTLQHERSRLKSEPTPSNASDIPSDTEPGTTLAEQAAQPGAPAVTRVLEETRLIHANRQRPPMMSLVLPLTEKAGTVPRELASISLPPMQPLQRSMRPTRRLRPALIALLCMAVVLLALPLGLFTWFNQHHHRIQPVQSGQTAINTAQPWLTSTAQAQATLQATLAAQARVQATAGITNSIGAGKILYSDDLTAPGGGWIDDGSQCYFSTQGYHVRSSVPREVAWCYSSQGQYTNVVITAQARLLYGDIYGLVFRLSPTSRQFYVLEIDSLGQYRFVRATGNNPLNWLTLIDWTPSSAIQSGYGNTNTFLIVANGPQFRFYINRQLIVTTFTDTAFSSGMIGFLVGGDTQGGAEAVFSNVWVFQK